MVRIPLIALSLLCLVGTAGCQRDVLYNMCEYYRESRCNGDMRYIVIERDRQVIPGPKPSPYLVSPTAAPSPADKPRVISSPHPSANEDQAYDAGDSYAGPSISGRWDGEIARPTLTGSASGGRYQVSIELTRRGDRLQGTWYQFGGVEQGPVEGEIVKHDVRLRLGFHGVPPEQHAWTLRGHVQDDELRFTGSVPGPREEQLSGQVRRAKQKPSHPKSIAATNDDV